MNPEELIYEHVGLSLETFQHSIEQLDEPLQLAADLLTDTLLNDGKILTCGMGSSAANGQGFATRMVSRFERERPGLPVLSLTGDSTVMTGVSHDTNPNDVFSRMLRTFAHETDILLALSSSGRAPAVMRAIQAAHELGLCVVALTGNNGGDVAALLDEHDVELRVPSERLGNIQLTHHMLLNCLSALIEHQLFGSEL